MSYSCPITGEPTCRCQGDSQEFLIINPKETLRKLFTDHAVYTKMFIVAFLDSRPEANFLQERLLNNQKEIGTYLSQYVGQNNGKAVTDLLTEHIVLAAGVLKELKNGGNVQGAISKVFVNVDKVAKALSGLSRGRLSYNLLYQEFGRHNEFVVEIAKLHFQGKYAEELIIYDQYYTHMLYFSDLVWYGLIY